MKWIKLFESFDNLENKIEFVNDAYCYFEIMNYLKEMSLLNLKKIETKDNIYFYSTSSGRKILMFVYCKKNRNKKLNKTLIYSAGKKIQIVSELIARAFNGPVPVGLGFVSSGLWNHLYRIYEKVLDDIFSEYTKRPRNRTLKIRGDYFCDLNWDNIRNSFRKLKEYKS